MPEAFADSGESSEITAGGTPQLQGSFIPGIDDSQFTDGFGIVTPWGGGSTLRRYKEYGISTDRDTQLNDLAFGLTPSAEAGGLGYGLQGDRGPQGPPGPQGLPGIVIGFGLNLPPYFQQNTNFLVELPHNIDQINQLGTAADRLIYTSAYTTTEGPIGDDLCIGVTDGDTLPEYGGGGQTPELREITLNLLASLGYTTSDTTKQGGQSSLRSWYQSFIPTETLTYYLRQRPN